MDPAAPFALAREALILAIALGLPTVAAAALLGLIGSAIQSATSLQDAAIAHLPKLVTVVVAVAIAAPWIGRTIVAFATRAFGG